MFQYIHRLMQQVEHLPEIHYYMPGQVKNVELKRMMERKATH